MSTATTTRPLTRFWLALEQLPGPAAVGPLWRALVRADFERVTGLLVPDRERAASFPDLGGRGDPYDVVAHGPDDFVGVREGGDPIPLRAADLVVYRLDTGALTRRVAGALGLDADGGPVEGLPGVHRVGRYRPAPPAGYPVYLTIQLEWRDHLRTVDALLTRTPGPFLLLAPTTRHHRSSAQERLEPRAAAFLPLADAVQWAEGGRWEATEGARALLAEFCSRVQPGPEHAGVRFPTPPGARWADVRIGFLDGHRVTVKVAAVTRTLNYTQMGFTDQRSAEPNVQWELLRTFAAGNGALTWASPAADKNQKRKELLAQALQAFFRIGGDPIVATDDGQGWQTAFAVVPD